MIEPARIIHQEQGYRVVPLEPARWDDFVTVLGRGGIGGCWCMYWIAARSAAWSEGAKGGSRGANKVAFKRLVDAGPAPGLLAYDAQAAIAWCRVMPRERMAGLANSRYFRTSLATRGVWSLSCFVVRPAHRGRGLVSRRPSRGWASPRYSERPGTNRCCASNCRR